MFHLRREIGLVFLAILWLSTITTGFCAWERYDATPGATAEVSTLPVQGDGRWTLVFYAHPRCPCTRAGLAELAEIAAASKGDLRLNIVFIRPAGKSPGWELTPSWEAALAIPHAEVRCDPEGVEAHRAGASTSGHAVLFDRSGTVAFSGGITRARGRAGSNPGREAILALVAGTDFGVRTTPVFGCPLESPSICTDAPGVPCRR